MKKLFLSLVLSAFVLALQAQVKKEIVFDNGIHAFLVSDDGKHVGLSDVNGKIIVPQKYGDVWLNGNVVLFKAPKDGSPNTYALYDYKGNCKIPENIGMNLEFCSIDGKFLYTAMRKQIYNSNGDLIYKFKTMKDSQGYYYLKNELSDTIVISSGYYRDLLCFMFSGGVIMTSNMGYKGVANLDGSVIIPAIRYKYILKKINSERELLGFYVRYSSDGGFVGYYDRQGKCIIPATKYTDLYKQSSGRFVAIEHGKACVLDSSGNLLFKTKYTGLEETKDKNGNIVYNTYLGNGKGQISYGGKLITEPKSSRLESNKEKDGFRYIEVIDENGKRGAKSTSGKVILPCEYEWISYTSSLHKIRGFKLKKDGFCGFANDEGKVIIPCEKYNDISSLQGDRQFFMVEIDGRVGLCNLDGREIVSPIYDKISISKNTIYANVGEKMGVIDDNGNTVIPFVFTRIDYSPEYSKVELYGKKGVCDDKGKIIIPPIYTGILRTKAFAGPFKEIYNVDDGKTRGIYTVDGKMVFPTGLFKNVMITNLDMGLPFKEDWYIYANNGSKEEYCCYDLNGKLLYDKRQDKIFDEYFEKGGKEFERKNYKKAIELYNQALNIKQDGSAHYNIGAAYYNLDKYKDAIKSLNSCIRVSQSQSLKDKAENLILDCEECLQRRRERRARIWLSLLGAGLNVANTIIQNNSYTQNYNSSTGNFQSSGSFRRDTSKDYLLDPRYAMMQVQQENWNEYLQMTNGGQTMSYQEWYAIKAQSYVNSKNEGNNTSSTTSDDSYGNSYSSYTSSGKNCSFCAGLGTCKTCTGRGYYYNPLNLSKTVACPNCKNHSGICSHCNGAGKL